MQPLGADESADLARAMKQRDPHAMAELYDRYGSLVYSRVFAIVRNQAQAEDLTQEVFLRIWNRVHTFDETRGSRSVWLLAVARNRAIDYLRTTGSRLERKTLSLDLQPIANSQIACENDAAHPDLFGRLSAAVSKLNLAQKSILRLAYEEGLSHAEMAHQLRQPLGTVKSRIRRALGCLRAELVNAGNAAATTAVIDRAV
ncbi:MAG TPA: sigma-70 family RNA polymerase sigma factor [Bryobacteraceae bacterium]